MHYIRNQPVEDTKGPVATGNRQPLMSWRMAAIGGGGCPGVGFGLRIVTYTLRRIELLEESVLEAPEEEQLAIEASSAAVRRRMHGLWGEWVAG